MEKREIVVWLTTDYKKSKVFYFDKKLTHTEIESEINKILGTDWYYFEDVADLMKIGVE